MVGGHNFFLKSSICYQGFPLGLLDGGSFFVSAPPPYRGAEIEMDGGGSPNTGEKKLFRAVDTTKKVIFQ